MKRTIAVTINLASGLWNSGINQNAIYLCEVLIAAGYNLVLLYDGEKETVESIEYLKDIECVHLRDKFNIGIHIDLLITMGVMLNQEDIDLMKNTNPELKTVAYKCGNEFFSDMENILFDAHSGRLELYKRGLYKPDQIWSIPQMEETCLDYYRYLFKQDKATVVPFIWSPTAIEHMCKERGYEKYNGEEINNLAVMEPNISVFKNILFPIFAIDRAYDKIKSIVKKYYMIGSFHLKDKGILFQIVSRSKMFKDKCITFEHRYPTMKVLNEHANIVFSWQMHNPLNYLYLDVAWMGYPIVHNGYLCKDIGYFYNEFNTHEAAGVLEYAVKTHKENSEYLLKNREAISRYLPTSQTVIDQYRELVEDVLVNRFRKRVYNSNTNVAQ